MKSLPDESAPEIAFAGRSNVGKSSLINLLIVATYLHYISFFFFFFFF
ncbi:GTPase [Wolbachia endosymbiont of Psylliodes chrysocephala]